MNKDLEKCEELVNDLTKYTSVTESEKKQRARLMYIIAKLDSSDLPILADTVKFGK